MQSRPEPHVTDDPVAAARVLASGGLVGLPTETVYGLAARADDERAVLRIFAVKGRPADHPLIVHLASAAELDDWAEELSPTARLLATRCWPGPLTIVVRARDAVPRAVTGGRDTVALRVPAHPLARDVIERVGVGIAAPSANRFGRVSPTTAQHVIDDLDGDVDLVLDGGPCDVGVESTIVDCTIDPPQILRPGGIAVEDLERLIGVGTTAATGPSRAPGMLEAHYAPRARVVLAADRDEAATLIAAIRAENRTAQLFDPTADLVAAAHDLYRYLREADESGADTVVAVLPERSGLGYAVRDRLERAAAGTSQQH
jgi:L-threonylcarbamoyladenylate synthase